MKNSRFFVAGMLVVLLAFTVVLAGCSSPKSLAKQTYQLQQDALKAGADIGKATSLSAKVMKIEEKVSKLSEADQKIYLEELARLGGM